MNDSTSYNTCGKSWWQGIVGDVIWLNSEGSISFYKNAEQYGSHQPQSMMFWDSLCDLCNLY